MTSLRRIAAVAVCTLAFTGLGTGAAQAGEILGNGDRVHPEHMLPGNSICAYSGQNDEYHEISTSYPRVQSWGQDVKVEGPMGGVPGTACNPTRGF